MFPSIRNANAQTATARGKLMREVKGCGTVDFRDSLLKSSHFTIGLTMRNQKCYYFEVDTEIVQKRCDPKLLRHTTKKK